MINSSPSAAKTSRDDLRSASRTGIVARFGPPPTQVRSCSTKVQFVAIKPGDTGWKVAVMGAN